MIDRGEQEHPTLDIFLPLDAPEIQRQSEAFSVSLNDAAHFDREGFSGDILLDKLIVSGVNALRINVDGKHPRKRMLPGTTRIYFVIDGTGTFTLNDDTKEVTPGDLYVIPPLNEYEYEGTMTLFEFNASKNNVFEDVVVEEAKVQTKEDELQALEMANAVSRAGQFSERHLAHTAFNQALGDILAHGHVLTRKDLSEISTHYDFSGANPDFHLYTELSKQTLKSAGVDLTVANYRGIGIYYDSNLPVDETEMYHVKRLIDEKKEHQAIERGFTPKYPTVKDDRALF